jgi:hypothetical protein
MCNKLNKNVGKNHAIKIVNKFFERMEDLRCLGTSILNLYSIQEEIKNRLKLGLLAIIWCRILLSKSIMINLYSTIILSAALYVCYTWSLMLREMLRLRVFESRMLRNIFGPKKNKVTGEWGRLYNEALSDLYSSPNIVLVIKSRRMRWAGHVARNGRGEVCTGFW